ncbi:MAG TPA: DUF4349 domain-containing protein [Gaiellaceae bacterium]|nr:DUF4349 domain-containing protein [Gaiellaceae bacterium]
MSQRDLVAELRSARIQAPSQVRERVRAIAAEAGAPSHPHRFRRRRSLVLLVPIAAALVGAIVLTRNNGSENDRLAQRGAIATVPYRAEAAPSTGTAVPAPSAKALAPAPSSTRVQRYGATIGLQVASPNAVSNAVKRALAITAALGGHPTSVHASSADKAGAADLVLRIPRRHVQEAVTRLSQLGTITSEQVDVQDLQAGLDATARRIARLQRQLATLRAEPQTPERDRAIASITSLVERLQRGEAATVRSAQLATVRLHVATPPSVQPVHHGHGPLHGIGTAAYWTAVGGAYALAFGIPLLALALLVWLVVRTVRRRRVDALLSRP